MDVGFVGFAEIFGFLDFGDEDPLQGDFPEVIEEFLQHGNMKCIAFNRRGTLLAGKVFDFRMNLKYDAIVNIMRQFVVLLIGLLLLKKCVFLVSPFWA